MDHRPVIAHIDWDVLDCGTVGSQDRYSLDSTLRVRALPKRGFTDAQVVKPFQACVNKRDVLGVQASMFEDCLRDIAQAHHDRQSSLS
eukprot:8579103-Pyramimonas_sp.AAC.1